MPRGKRKSTEPTIDSYIHDGKKRKNNPPVGLVSTITDKLNGRTKYEHDPHIDPTLSWAGKKEGMSFEVQNVSLHIHERIDPMRIVKSFLKPKKEVEQLSLFDEPENNQPLIKAIDFYRHEQDWSNRLIAGDSLLVMNSLLVKEGMAGKVQMVYIDPPYGIKYNSNFQPFVNDTSLKQADKDEDLVAEPEMIQAFRDTWELDVHSYLTYIRDRILISKQLLGDSGSIFIQISEENVHRVRSILDEIFGPQNFISQINIKRASMMFAKKLLNNAVYYVIWYAKNKESVKYHQLFTEKDAQWFADSAGAHLKAENPANNSTITVPSDMRKNMKEFSIKYPGWKLYRLLGVNAQGSEKRDPFEFEGRSFVPPSGTQWKYSYDGLNILKTKNRLEIEGTSLACKVYLSDYPVESINSLWEGIGAAGDKIYVVQTSDEIVKRCILMTTDPGEIVLDITCGSGTTAFVSEQWGRRWITCDTSRVAITLAKQRLMTARYDYYKLAHPQEGVKSGFEFNTASHVTLGSIANNEPTKQEILYDQPSKVSGVVRVTGPFTVEAVPSLRIKPFDGNMPKLEVGGQELARTGESGKQTEWRDELKTSGIRAVGGHTITFSRVEPITATRFLHARAEVLEKDGTNKLAYISFGPDFGPLEQRQAEAAITECRSLKEKPDFVIFAAFHFDPEASKDIDQMKLPGVTIIKAQMSVDLLTADLRKKRSSSQSYWLIGQPDVEVKKQNDGRYIVKLHGFDYYDPISGEIISKGTKHIAMWFLDTDYDERSIFPDQVFFPEGDSKSDWTKLAKALKSEVNEDTLKKFSGVESIPFTPGENNKIAIKIIDNRGIESFVIKGLE